MNGFSKLSSSSPGRSEPPTQPSCQAGEGLFRTGNVLKKESSGASCQPLMSRPEKTSGHLPTSILQTQQRYSQGLSPPKLETPSKCCWSTCNFPSPKAPALISLSPSVQALQGQKLR